MSFKRGTLYLTAAWASLPITGYVLNVWLARTFGPEEYGIYGLVMSILMWLEIFVITGLPYAVQKFVASDESNAYPILWTAGRFQLGMVVVLFTVCFFLAPLLGTVFRNDRFIFYFRIATFHLVFYGFFHLLVSFQNGLRHFGKQALLFFVYSLSKLGFVFLLVSLFHTLTGAFLANAAGSLLGLAVGLFFLNERKERPSHRTGEILRFAIPTLLFTVTFTLLLYLDLWVVSFHWGDVLRGHYVAASMVARIPYFLVLGLSSTVLPTVSWNLASDALEQVRSTIASSMRFLLMVTLPIGILLMMFSHETMALLYSSEYLPGGNILTVLIWGNTLLAFLLLLATVIIADHRPKLAFGITGAIVILDAVLNLILVPGRGAMGGAISTTLAAGVGVLMTLAAVYIRFRVLIRLKSLVRIGLAAAAMGLGLWLWDVHGNGFVLAMVLGIVFYGALLMVFKEITPQDFRHILPRKEREETAASPYGDALPM